MSTEVEVDVKASGPANFKWPASEQHSVVLKATETDDQCINPKELDPAKKLTTACALDIRNYLLSNARVELGCMILLQDQQFKIVPFENTDPTSVSVRLGTDQDFLRMAEFYRGGLLWGWAHSHPWGRPYPSMTDLEQHSLRINMVIYGGFANCLSIYSTAEINQLYEATKARGLSSYIALEHWLKGTE